MAVLLVCCLCYKCRLSVCVMLRRLTWPSVLSGNSPKRDNGTFFHLRTVTMSLKTEFYRRRCVYKIRTFNNYSPKAK